MADIDALFESISNEIINEDIKLQMAVLFENALTEAVKAKELELQEDNKKELSTFKEDLVNKLDDYITHFTEEFVKNNSSVIEESVKVKTAEKVIRTFNRIVQDFHLQLDEGKVVVEDGLKESKKAINDLTKQLIEARKDTKLLEKAAIVLEASFGLTTDLEKAKLTEYAKNLDHDSLFEKKVSAFCKTVLTESKIKSTDSKKEKLVIVEDKQEFLEEKVANPVNSYVNSL
jgi:hypothetical protein